MRAGKIWMAAVTLRMGDDDRSPGTRTRCSRASWRSVRQAGD